MKKVLIIDDDPDILEAIQIVLETGGYASDTTTRGEEAQQKIESYQPDLIILDIYLSGQDGRQICEELKRDKKTEHIPIIMFSAHPTAEKTIKNCRADAFIAKPFSINGLLEQVKRFTT